MSGATEAPAGRWVPARSTWPGIEGQALPGVWHLDGIDWYDAPAPRRWHRCRAQTKGRDILPGGNGWVYRCACGATSEDEVLWTGRNARNRWRTP